MQNVVDSRTSKCEMMSDTTTNSWGYNDLHDVFRHVERPPLFGCIFESRAAQGYNAPSHLDLPAQHPPVLKTSEKIPDRVSEAGEG